ncbi:hypothetical protein Ancab_020567 [Ancistrocladus abbreviatus]
METWFLVILTLCISALIRSIFHLLFTSQPKQNHHQLPPGPPAIPLISRLRLLGKTGHQIESIIRSLRSKYGPILTLPVGSRPAIFIFSRSLAHQALVQNGALFADRPKPLVTGKILSSNQHNINSAAYGPAWRLLRRNLTAEILHPSRVKSYSHARKWVLHILLSRLNSESCAGAAVKVIDHFHYAMFCLLVLMCFGDKLDEDQIKEIETVHRRLLVAFSRFQILDFWPSLTKIIFHRRWRELFQMKSDQSKVVIPLIRARKGARINGESTMKEKEDEHNGVVCYVDTLLKLELPEDGGKRSLTEEEMVTLCSEFMNAGTDTTSTALQWIMANIVKNPSIQTKLFDEINSVVEGGAEEVTEEDLGKMPYLRAVILEGLRRHPPGHFVLPHAVVEEVELGGYAVPKNAVINFMVADMGWDPEVWEDPMEFKPERFLPKEREEEFDITGSREIKMMPFGVGRRICPGYGLAILHLEYFAANLVWNFEWKIADGEDVDLAEKQEFTIVMKHPLRVQIFPRKNRMHNKMIS